MKKIIIAIILLIISGCASAPKQDVVRVFYPDPPEPARLQFLTFLTGEKDIVGKKSAFEKFITGAGESSFRLDKPYGAAIYAGKIYVCDTNQGVFVFDLENRTLSRLQGAQGMGKLSQPINIRVDADGRKFVSDPVRGQVVVFDKNDFYVTAFGLPGDWKPVDAVPFGDDLYVADMKSFQVIVLDKKAGGVVRRIGAEGEPGDRIGRPTNLAFDKDGHLLVSDMARFQVLTYDRDGHFLGTIGQPGQEGGTFSRPKGITVDREQRRYVVDAAFSNVQIFNKDGNLLFSFGVQGTRPGDLDLPAQVIVDYDNIKYFQKDADPNFEIENLVLVVNQFGNKMINVYAMGKERGKHYLTDAELLEQLKARLEKERAAKQSGGKKEEISSQEPQSRSQN